MKPQNVPLDPDSVLANLDWVRGLAHRLVTDPDVADDVAQEAWMAALRHGRSPERPLRAWLGRVVRNCMRQVRRREGIRRGHELAAGREDTLPSAAELVERAAVQRTVVDAVLTLDEPYRRTVFLRYFEGQTPSDIARHTDTSLATVKTRLRRGLALLRERMDADHGGDGRTWALALAPLVAPRVPEGPPGLPWKEVLLVSTSLKITLSVGVAAVAAVLLVQLRTGQNDPPVEPALAAAPPAELVAPDRPPEKTADSLLPVRMEVEAEAPVPEAPPSNGELVHGRVIDVTNMPVGGVAIGLRSASGGGSEENRPYTIWREDLPTEAEAVATSASDGRFTLMIDDQRGYLVSVDERWETVHSPSSRTTFENTLVVAPRFSLHGQVRDETGAPVSGARLVFVLPDDFKLGLDMAATGRENGWATSTDAEGGFALLRLPNVEGALLRVRKVGYALRELERTPWDDEMLELTLEPLLDWVEGIVRDPGGAPVEGAHVALGYRGVRTAADGRFRLHLQGLAEATTIRAAAPGYLPTSLEGQAGEDGSGPSWPPLVELTLGEEALSISGRVTDADGADLVGFEILLSDPDPFYADGGAPVQVESVLAGDASWWTVQTETDESGGFRFTGLQRRDYHFRAIDPDSGLVFEAGPFPAGSSDVEIVIPADATWPQVRGRVVASSGEAVAGVRLSISSHKLRVRVPGTDQAYLLQAHGASCQTADDGSFVLVDVPRHGVTLHGHSDGMSSFAIELTADTKVDDLEIVAGLEVHVRLHLFDPNAADQLFLLDAQGEPLLLKYDTSVGHWSAVFADLVDGWSPVISTADSAVELVLLKDNEEILRVPVHLLSGEINELEL